MPSVLTCVVSEAYSTCHAIVINQGTSVTELLLANKAQVPQIHVYDSGVHGSSTTPSGGVGQVEGSLWGELQWLLV